MLKKLKIKLFKRSMEDYEINIDELKRKQRNGAVIVDVRSLQEFNEGHINGAINIPYYSLLNNYSIYLSKNKTYYLYCDYGIQSKEISNRLNMFGYNTYYVKEGYLDFKNKIN